MVLMVVVAMVGMSAVRTVRQGHRAATVVIEPWTPHGKTLVMRTEPRAPEAPTVTKKKLRPTRIAEAEGAPLTWEVVGEFRLNENEAWDSALDAARNQVTHDLGLVVPPSREAVRQKLVKDWAPDTNKKLLEGTELAGTEAVRMKLHLELDRGSYRDLADADRAARADDRMEGMTRVMSVLVVALAAVAGYIRLDDLTKGYYTGRLRALTVVLVAAATFAISRV
jgi:hypothetical protein